MAGLNVDTLGTSLVNAGKAVLGDISAGGRNLDDDFNHYVLPELRDLAGILVLIASRVAPDGLSAADAATLAAQEVTHRVTTISFAVATLTAIEVQKIVNDAVAAVSGLVNGALGFALL